MFKRICNPCFATTTSQRFYKTKNSSVSSRKTVHELEIALAVEKKRGELKEEFAKERGELKEEFAKELEKERGKTELEKQRGQFLLASEQQNSKSLKSNIVAKMNSHSIRSVLGKCFFNYRNHFLIESAQSSRHSKQSECRFKRSKVYP